MSTRLTLLLSLLVALALPVAGWQLVRQTEALLREGQERAQLGAAQALARAVAVEASLPPAGATYYLHRVPAPIVIDGSADDWSGLEASRSSDGRLAVTLADDGSAVHALIEVDDATRVRADAADPLGRRGDRIELALRDPRGLRQWRLANAAPGPINALDEHGVPLRGEWQETAGGYRIELRLPPAAADGTLGLVARDARGDGSEATLALGSEAGSTLPILRADAARDQALAALAPDGARLRLVSSDGWVVGQAGALNTAPTLSTQAGGWRGWLYRLLLAPPAGAPGDFADDRARIDAPVVWQALSGVPASHVRASGASGTVVVSAAVPLPGGHGALLLEQSSDALLVLANRGLSTLVAATLATVLVAGLLLTGFAGVQGLRIRRLRNAAERALRPDGRLDAHLPHLAAHDDLGDLSRSFARLLGEVGAYTDYLRTLASKLSHELSTPLAIVRSSLDNLEHERLPSEARTYALRARAGADRLAGILRAMAEASRVERAIAGAEGEDFDLAALARGCAEAYRDLAAPRRVLLELPPGPLPFHGAPDLIAQALDKLIDNARSFAPADGWIRFALAAEGEGVVLSVANNGPPLPARMQDRLFDSLVSVRDGADAHHLGLGLYIVRLVAELHRGEARAQNLADGSGVVFSLHLGGMPRRPL
jgi:dedicated sortase system histidine kinase